MGGRVLFIVIDQLRASCLSGDLARVTRLPNLRRLMAEGVTFTRHHTVTAPCGPARASLLTGRYAMNHRSVRNGTPLAADIPTLPGLARQAGYEPLLFGYTDTAPDPRRLPARDPALTRYEGVMPGFTPVVPMMLDTGGGPWIAALRARGHDIGWHDHAVYKARDMDGRPAPILGPALYDAADSDTAFLTDRVLAGLDEQAGQDWFIHVAYLRPHPPLVAPAPWNSLYPPDSLPPPNRKRSVDSLRQAHPFNRAFFSGTAGHGLYIGFDGRMDRISDADSRALRAVYCGLASEVDAHVGRLLDNLDRSGAAADTLVLVTADHGDMLGDHHMWGKETVYEPSFHIPLILRDPRRRQTAGRRVTAFTESVDVMPTLLDWLGLPPRHDVDGRSLLPWLAGESPSGWRDYVFCELDLANPVAPTRFQTAFNLPATACNAALLREDRYKLVHFNGGLPPMLFDMVNDPTESENLAGDPAHAPVLLRLGRRMLDHRMTHADQSLALIHLTESGARTGSRFPDGASRPAPADAPAP